MYLMQDITDLWNRVSYLVLCAPDSFPVDDFLSDDDQMTLDKWFSQLHEGISIAYPKNKFSGAAYDDLRHHLKAYLDDARTAYDAGEVVKAAHLLQDFRNEIFIKKGKVRRLE